MSKTHQHKRLAKLLALVVFGFIPVVVLLWAFFGREPELACGSWWYGLLLPLAAMVRLDRRR